MIARIAEHREFPPDLDPESLARARAIIAEQPGFCGGYDLVDLATGCVLSLTMWQSRDALSAAEKAGEGASTDRMSHRSCPSVRVADVTAVF